jgi:hypothetical protein
MRDVPNGLQSDSSIHPTFGLLDAVASRFGDGLHPELRRLMAERAAEAQQVQAANIVAFPAAARISGPPAPCRATANADSEACNVVAFPGKVARAPRPLLSPAEAPDAPWIPLERPTASQPNRNLTPPAPWDRATPRN